MTKIFKVLVMASHPNLNCWRDVGNRLAGLSFTLYLHEDLWLSPAEKDLHGTKPPAVALRTEMDISIICCLLGTAPSLLTSAAGSVMYGCTGGDIKPHAAAPAPLVRSDLEMVDMVFRREPPCG
ncbi:MAG: hypothetical protein H7Z19_19535 [Chitinophagaceae bacterium]|nr:hypothetical protein [Rubrivivax sp.]